MDAQNDRSSKMRYWELLLEADAAPPKKVGREFNHLEDLVFTESNGAVKAIQILDRKSVV